MTVDEKLIKVREQMNLLGLDAFVVLSTDPHCSEYPAEHWKFREFLSGFNGSAGTLVITQQYVGLWVDSRYYVQAFKQLRGTSIELFRYGMPKVPSYVQWLTYMLPSGSIVGVDGFTLPYSEYSQMQKEFAKFGIGINYKVNIIDELFTLREPMPLSEVTFVEDKFVTAQRYEKIGYVRRYMQRNNITHYLVSSLDDIAYFLNMRGTDVTYNPVFYAYLIITLKEVHLYIDPHKLTSVVSRMLERDGIKVSLYDHYEKNLSNLPDNAHVCYDPAKANTRNVKALPQSAVKIEELSVIECLKSHKTAYEIDMAREVHIRDGVAMVRFLAIISNTQALGCSELELADMIDTSRSIGAHYQGPAFEPIVAFADNSAIVHYSPSPESTQQVDDEKPTFLLIDTGGQYADGTTDITRTITIGSDEDWASDKCAMMRSDYTLVLKSNITLARAVFPEGTNGMQLDTFARLHLWKNGLDFGHGSGHGVGVNLCVHEGPIHMSKKVSPVSMQAGMIVSNEPGIYRTGKYGIRIENLMLCHNSSYDKQFGDFYNFETLTLCPFDRRAIDVDLLTDNELAWINNYHRRVYDLLHKRLNLGKEDEVSLRWLEKATAPIRREE